MNWVVAQSSFYVLYSILFTVVLQSGLSFGGKILELRKTPGGIHIFASVLL